MLENTTAVLTFVLAMTVFTVVCLPMNDRSLTEKMFLLSVGISLLAASLDRLSHIFSYYDYDGSVGMLAEIVISVSRVSAVFYGTAWMLEYLFSRSTSCIQSRLRRYGLYRKNN